MAEEEGDQDRRRGRAELGGGTRRSLCAGARRLRLASRLLTAVPPAVRAAGVLPGTMRRAARSRPEPHAGPQAAPPAAPAAGARRPAALTLERRSRRPPGTGARALRALEVALGGCLAEARAFTSRKI